ncbi:MAG: hypothetical protein HGA85_06640 [Nanoarchaeota archaeon]|nr:hypothetical protein [Nanoarchaeota archaeon]
MPQLPDINEVETVVENQESNINVKLYQTEDLLKRLFTNIEAFKRIELENDKLRRNILENQAILKQEYKRKLNEVTDTKRAQEQIEAGRKEDLLKNYKDLVAKLTVKLVDERKKSQLVVNKYQELIYLSKNIDEENKRLKQTLIENHDLLKADYEKRRKAVELAAKLGQIELSSRHRGLLKETEEARLDLLRKLELEKNRNALLQSKGKELFTELSTKIQEIEKAQLQVKALQEKILFLEKKSIANEDILKARQRVVEQEFESKLKLVAKQHLESEVESKAKIDSLTKDLTRYMSELKDEKLKYFSREKELKEKISKLI